MPEPPAIAADKIAPFRGAECAEDSVGWIDRTRSGGQEQATDRIEGQIVCAVESPHFFGAGRMKKWRGRPDDADDLQSQLTVHFKLRDNAELAVKSRAGDVHHQVLLQFFDKELNEYIDLEASSWQDFMLQVLLFSKLLTHHQKRIFSFCRCIFL